MTLNDHKKIITGVGSQNVDISKQKSAQRTNIKNTSKTKRANELARPFCSQIHRHRGNMRLHGIFPGDICGSIAALGVSIDGGYPKMDGVYSGKSY